MLRRSLELQILATLECPPYLYPEDFKLRATTNNEKDASTRLQINYLGDAEQHFIAIIPHKKTKVGDYGDEDFAIVCRFNPGEITDDQTLSIRGQQALLQEVKAWVQRLNEDVKKIPEFRAVEQLGDKLAEIEERLADIPDEYATPDQIVKLQQLLNELEKQLKAQINALETSVDEKRKKIDDLEKQFSALRQKSQGGKMRQMMRAIVSRVYRVATDPDLPKLIENGKSIAGMLTDGSGPDLPQST